MTLDMTTDDEQEALEAGHQYPIEHTALEHEGMEAGRQDVPLFLNAYEAIELRRCEGVVEKGLVAFLDVGQALWQIRQSRLYREKHTTFEEYVEDRWLMSKSQAYRLISATEIVHQIEEAGSPIGDNGEHLLPANAAQARPLSQLAKHQRAGAWQTAVEKAGGQPTAQVVQEVVSEMLPPKPEKADAAALPLFDVETTQEAQTGLAPPGPVPALNNLGDNAPVRDADMTDEECEESASRPASAAGALANLNDERDATVKEWSEDESSEANSDAGAEAGAAAEDGASAAAPEPVHAPDMAGVPETDPAGTGDAVSDDGAPDVAAPVAQKPAVGAPVAKPLAVAPKPEAAKATAPAAPPAPPAGMIATLVKEADFHKAMEMGLWPPAFAIQTVNDLEAHIKALDAREINLAETQLVPAETPVPPSMAMTIAGAAASRLAEINATAGTILQYSEIQLLDELFPDRETTAPDHIVAVLLTARLRDMTIPKDETN